jgi:hypothetical protein
MTTTQTLKQIDYNDEASFCPISCDLSTLDRAIDLTTSDRQKFLEGVRHARIILRAATNNFQGHTAKPPRPLALRAGVFVLQFLVATGAAGAFIFFMILWASLFFTWTGLFQIPGR